MPVDKLECLLKQCYWLLSPRQRFKIALILYKAWALKGEGDPELTTKQDK